MTMNQSIKGGVQVNISKVIYDAFFKISGERVEKVGLVKAESNPVYNQAKQNWKSTYDEFATSLNDEQKKALQQLDEAYAAVHSYEMQYAYAQGIEDRVMLIDELKSFGFPK